MAKQVHRKYTAEYKRQAVELAKSIGIKKAGAQLGITPTNIYSWQKKVEEDKPVTKLNLEEENRKLRAQVEEQRQVIHILKAAAAFFSKDHLP